MKWHSLVPALIVFVAGCGGEGGGSGATAVESRVQFGNFSPDSGPLRVSVDDTIHSESLAYLQSSGQFRGVGLGVRDLVLSPAVGGDDLWAETQTYAGDDDFFIAVYGLLNFGEEAIKRLRFTSIEVNREVPNGNKARVYVFHGLNEEPQSDSTAIDFRTPEDPPLFQVNDLDYGDSGVLNLDAGEITFEVRRANTELVYLTLTRTFEAGKIYFLGISGVIEGQEESAPRITVLELPRR